MLALKVRLEAAGLRVWYDVEWLTPGSSWQAEMEQGIRVSHTVVVCVGADGEGPWQAEEVQGAMQLAVDNGQPVIPVLCRVHRHG